MYVFHYGLSLSTITRMNTPVTISFTHSVLYVMYKMYITWTCGILRYQSRMRIRTEVLRVQAHRNAEGLLHAKFIQHIIDRLAGRQHRQCNASCIMHCIPMTHG